MRYLFLTISIILFHEGNTCAQKSITLPDSLVQVFPLSEQVKETSGLIFWNQLLWTHNDDGDSTLYGINPVSGEIERELPVSGLTVTDWEELQQDDEYLYIGDTGNNYRGNRTDLRILKKEKTLQRTDTIRFYYPEQTDFSVQKANSTDFDCEAFLVTDSMIYLFTKEWSSQATRLYKIPNSPGNHTAKKTGSLKVNGLITGAAFHPSQQLIVLIGYTKTLHPFLYILHDFQKDDFLNGRQQRLKINKRFLQTESVCFINSSKIAVTNEQFNHTLVKSPQQLLLIELSSFISR